MSNYKYACIEEKWNAVMYQCKIKKDANPLCGHVN